MRMIFWQVSSHSLSRLRITTLSGAIFSLRRQTSHRRERSRSTGGSSGLAPIGSDLGLHIGQNIMSWGIDQRRAADADVVCGAGYGLA